MEKMKKKYKDVLIPLVPGEDFPGIDGKYLSTNSLIRLFKQEYPDGYTKTEITAYEPAVYVTVSCSVYADKETYLGSRSKTKVFICNDAVDEESQIEQAQSNAVWKALSAAGVGIDFTIAAEISSREETLDKVQEIIKKHDEGKQAIISENKELTAAETFDALLAMSAAKDQEFKQRKVPEKEKARAEEETKTDSFDPFAEEGITPPQAPAVETPEESVKIETEGEKSSVPGTEVNDEYVIRTEDFTFGRYATQYAGEKLGDVPKEELTAIYGYGEKAITKEFAALLKKYLKGRTAA